MTSEAADSPQDIPVDLALDYYLSFTVGTGSTASTSSSKISENRLPKGEKSPCQSTVQKSSGKGKSLGSPYGSKKKTPVGNTPSGEGYGPIKRDDGSDKSKSNDDLGVVRSGRNGGMEPHFSFDIGKPKARDAPSERSDMDGVDESMVGLLLRQANDSRSTNLQVESAITSLARAKLERIQQTRRSHGKEKLELRDSCSGMQREYEEHDGDASVCVAPTTQSIDKLKRISFGGLGMCINHREKGVVLQANLEGDGMEGIEQDERLESH